MRRDSASVDDTLVEDDGTGRASKREASSDAIVNATAINSTITSERPEACMRHVRGLLEDIEALQKVLAADVQGGDLSQHHQNFVDSYFRARGYLDQVVLGSSNVGASSPSTHLRTQIRVDNQDRVSQHEAAAYTATSLKYVSISLTASPCLLTHPKARLSDLSQP